ncbi:MAG: type II secretion system protein [bacterium]|nr:type II secretion system protein [bacterium]
MMRAYPTKVRRAGLTLIELILVAVVLGLLATMLVEASTTMGRVTSSGNVQGVLQQEGEKALKRILADMRSAGTATVNGAAYPIVFDGGTAPPPYGANSHPPAGQEAEPGDPDEGVMREIVFVLPADLDSDGRPEIDVDGDGVPELDGDGDGTRTDESGDTDGLWDPTQNTIDAETGLVWAHDEVSYVVITRPDGINYLERRLNGDAATARRIARNIERVQFDTALSSGFEIPLDSVRVRVFFRDRDSAGTLYRHDVEVVLRLRNG